MKDCPFCGGKGQIKSVKTPYSHGWVGCPDCKVYINWNYDPSGALKKWDRRTTVKVTTAVFDVEEIHDNCTVQILKNSVTGETSVGWWEN